MLRKFKIFLPVGITRSVSSVREIVALAGVTKPVLYYYFRNKEDIYLALIYKAMGGGWVVAAKTRVPEQPRAQK
jgi:AcrR family transcriptional regulator